MNFYVVFCGVLCAVSCASSASLRFPRQLWPQRMEDHHFHFPEPSSNDFPDRFNEVIDFPDRVTRPSGQGFGTGFGGKFGNNQNRPDFGQWPNGPNRQDTTTMRTTTTSTERGSTPRTFHLVPEGCTCASTPQFNPVCGSDGNTYKNSGLLNCFRRCGINVSQRRMGAC